MYLDGHLSERQLLRQLVRSLPHAIVLKDRLGHYCYANDTFCEMVGETESEVLGRKARELFGPQVGSAIRQQEMKTYASGEETQFSQPVSLEGENRVFDVTILPVTTGNPDPDAPDVEATIGIWEDITTERSIHIEKEQSQATYRSMIDSARDCIFVVGTDGTLLDVNSSLCRMVDRRPQGVIDTPFMDLVTSSETDADVQASLQRALEGNSERLEMGLAQPDGSTVPMDVRLQRIPYFGSRAVLGIGRDISGQKKQEQKLREAKTQAEKGAQLRSAMLANVSHEIRTPLTSIIGISDVLQEELDGTRSVFARKIRTNGDRLLQTLDAVLRLSQLDAGMYEPNKQWIEVGEIVREALETLTVEDAAADDRVSMSLPDDPVLLRTDEDACRRIVRHLLQNALKFTEPGDKVWVAVESTDTEAVIKIEDSGIGMDEEFLPKAFEAFRQESNGNNREYEGTGLGLAIAKHLTDCLNGEIQLESEKGEGTHVTVHLPT